MFKHNVRKLKRSNLQALPASLDKGHDYLSHKVIKRSPKKRALYLDMEAVDIPRYKHAEGSSDDLENQHLRQEGSGPMRAHYERFLHQPISQFKQLGQSEERKALERPKSLVRSWVMSSLTTGRDSSESSIELPLIHIHKPINQKACFAYRKPHKDAFSFELVVGKGGFGKVWRVRHKKSGQYFAMKELQKAAVIARKSVTSILNELKLLTRLHHPFLINAHYAFQDRVALFLALDYVNGGDLRCHITKKKKFSEQQTRFFVCCILVALGYLHSQKVIHRDLKPENLVFDQKGYLRLTDLGISKEAATDNGVDTSGTPGYMAPEVIIHHAHSYECDFFALGVITHELMLGRRPYTGRSRHQIREQMMLKPVAISDPPKGWSQDSLDFVRLLLVRKPANRLGAHGGFEEVKTHTWLAGFNWRDLLKFKMPAPYVPATIEDDYANYHELNISSILNPSPTVQMDATLLLKSSAVQNLFDGYELNVDQKSSQLMKSQSEAKRKKYRSLSRRL